MTTAAIPNRPVFRAQEVCEIAQVQPYVLRSWEAEFPDLGLAKKAGDARVYRRADVERVLQLRHLLFVDGLTLAGARKRLGVKSAPVPVEVPERDRSRERERERERGRAEREVEATGIDADVAALLDDEARENLREVRHGLQWILGVLAGGRSTQEDREIVLSRRSSRASARRRTPPRRAAHKSARVVKRANKKRQR